MDYESMLKRAEDKISRSDSQERFEMPTVTVSVQGNGTVVTNFFDVARTLRREPKHMMKFLTRELAVPGELKGNRALFQGRFTADNIQTKLKKYADEYVFCSCGKPDTELLREERLLRLKCQACGIKRVVKDIG